MGCKVLPGFAHLCIEHLKHRKFKTLKTYFFPLFLILGRTYDKAPPGQNVDRADFFQVVPIDQTFADLIEALQIGYNLETLEIVLIKTSYSNKMVRVPMSMSLRNLAYIFGKPKEEVFRLVLVEKLNQIWMEANT